MLVIIAVLRKFCASRGSNASYLAALCGHTELVFIGTIVFFSTSIGPIVEPLCGFRCRGRARALIVVSHGIERIP